MNCTSILMMGNKRCDVSDALLKLGHPNGGFLSDLTLWSPKRQEGNTKIIGPAYTVRYALNGTGAPIHQGHYVIRRCPLRVCCWLYKIDSIPAGAVVFISSPRTLNAVYGGLMSNRAQVLGAVGTIVDGRVRDLEEHRGLKFPVLMSICTNSIEMLTEIGVCSWNWNRTTIRSSDSEWGKSQWANICAGTNVYQVNVPVKLQTDEQNATINPGDYLIGDLNGVVCLPRELSEQAIVLLASQAEADRKIASDIQAGIPFVDASKKHRSTLVKP